MADFGLPVRDFLCLHSVASRLGVGWRVGHFWCVIVDWQGLPGALAGEGSAEGPGWPR